MYLIPRVPTPSSTALLSLVAARVNNIHDVAHEPELHTPSSQRLPPPSHRARISRCDVSFEKLKELLHLGPVGLPCPDQASPLLLIDVREKAEVARDGKIPNSVNLPLGELKKALLSDCEDFGSTYGFPKPEKHHENVIFYSINHVKSASAVEIAHRLGYRKARHYSGGYDDWISNQIHHMNLHGYHDD